jgi:hypothetical protein
MVVDMDCHKSAARFLERSMNGSDPDKRHTKQSTSDCLPGERQEFSLFFLVEHDHFCQVFVVTTYSIIARDSTTAALLLAVHFPTLRRNCSCSGKKNHDVVNDQHLGY